MRSDANYNIPAAVFKGDKVIKQISCKEVDRLYQIVDKEDRSLTPLPLEILRNLLKCIGEIKPLQKLLTKFFQEVKTQSLILKGYRHNTCTQNLNKLVVERVNLLVGVE